MCFCVLIVNPAEALGPNDNYRFDDAAVLWRGFEQKWNYNHRMNRMGDYIVQGDFDGFPHPVKHIHSSATGLGKDEVAFQSYYSELKTKRVGIKAGQVSFDLIGKEKEALTAKEILKIELPDNLRSKDEIVVLLNGYDLISLSKADKMKHLSINISDGKYVDDGESLEFEIDVSFIVNCASLECNQINNRFSYSLDVYYLIIGGDKFAFNSTEKAFSRTMEWDKKESSFDDLNVMSIDGEGGYEYATVGFKSISLNLDRDHWLVDWHTAIHKQGYDRKSGNYTVGLDLFVRQWRDRSESFYKGMSLFQKKKAGFAKWDGSVVLLQFRKACIKDKVRLSNINWKGKNASAAANDALNVERFKIEDDCK